MMEIGRQKNVQMQDRYAMAYERIDCALGAQYPIEAVMIVESIITDRIEAHLRRRLIQGYPIRSSRILRLFETASQGEEFGHVSLKEYVKEFRRHFDDLGVAAYMELPEHLSAWLPRRNRAAHAFVRAHPTERTYREDIQSFLDEIEACARDGLRLARRLSVWARRRGALVVPLRD